MTGGRPIGSLCWRGESAGFETRDPIGQTDDPPAALKSLVAVLWRFEAVPWN